LKDFKPQNIKAKKKKLKNNNSQIFLEQPSHHQVYLLGKYSWAIGSWAELEGGKSDR
jgi:hypothetical protein